MRKDTDLLDDLLGWLAARLWRKIITRRAMKKDDAWKAKFMAWKRENPHRCMNCAYTAWANQERGLKFKLKLLPHDCVEGNSPPALLPRMRLLQKNS